MNPNASPRLLAAVTTIVIVALSISCNSEPPPLEPPRIELHGTRFLGTSITREQAVDDSKGVAFDLATTFRVRCRVHWFEKLPEHTFSPLHDHIKSCVDIKNGHVLSASTTLMESAWIVTGADAATRFDELIKANARSASLGDLTIVLPRGVTMSVENYGTKVDSTPRAGTLSTAFEVTHLSTPEASGDELRVSIDVKGYLSMDDASNPDQKAELVEREEVVVLSDAPKPSQSPLVLLFIPRLVAGAFLVAIDAEPYLAADATDADREAGARDLATCLADVKIAGELQRIEASPDPLFGLSTLESEYRRGALARLAIVNAAPIATDFSYVADDPTIDDFVNKLGESRKGKGVPKDVALELERVTWKYLADRMSGTDFPNALAAIAVRHAGEAGRFPAVLEDVSATAKSVLDIQQRFIGQNRSLLEDRSPSSRVRAYEWLSAIGLAPEGYDPLASVADRKKALRAAEDKEAAAATAVGGGS